MTAPLAQPPALNATFSLARALRWLGHSCPGCQIAADEVLQAPVWFIRRGITLLETTTLVVVDLTGCTLGVDDRRQMLQAVNHCTQPDRIRVHERHQSDVGRALAAVACTARVSTQAEYRAFGRTRSRP